MALKLTRDELDEYRELLERKQALDTKRPRSKKRSLNSKPRHKSSWSTGKTSDHSIWLGLRAHTWQSLCELEEGIHRHRWQRQGDRTGSGRQGRWKVKAGHHATTGPGPLLAGPSESED